MKMLITGGAGFIGSHRCEKYIKEGHVEGDIRDFDLLEKFVQWHKDYGLEERIGIE